MCSTSCQCATGSGPPPDEVRSEVGDRPSTREGERPRHSIAEVLENVGDASLARGTQAVAKEAEQKKANKFDEISKYMALLSD